MQINNMCLFVWLTVFFLCVNVHFNVCLSACMLAHAMHKCMHALRVCLVYVFAKNILSGMLSSLSSCASDGFL